MYNSLNRSSLLTLTRPIQRALAGHADVPSVLLLIQSVLIVSLGIGSGWITGQGSALTQMTMASAIVCLVASGWLIHKALADQPWRGIAARPETEPGPSPIESWQRLIEAELEPDSIRQDVASMVALEIDQFTSYNFDDRARALDCIRNQVQQHSHHADDQFAQTSDGQFRILWRECDVEQARCRCLKLRESFRQLGKARAGQDITLSIGLIELPMISARCGGYFFERLAERLSCARSAGGNEIFVSRARDNLIQFPVAASARLRAVRSQQGLVG